VLDRTLGTLSMRLGVLCDHALVGQDGKLSVIGIFDHIGVLQLPAQHPRFFVVAVLQGDAPGESVEMELVAPSGSVLMHEAITIDPDTIAQGNGNLIAEVTMLPLEHTGRYEFRMLAEGEVLGIIPLNVSLVNANQPPQLQVVPRA
jgi:Family of unknown function (DUF6941)